MKKHYSFIIASIFTLLTGTSTAVTHTVMVGPSNTNTFSPSSFAAVIGDVVVWELATGTHDVRSITVPMSSVPAGAAAISSPTLSTPGQTYSYTITVAGNYGYECSFHGNLAAFSGMIGGFTVTATSIAEPNVNLLTSVYPNPFNDKVTIKYNGIESVEVFNVVGERLKSIDLSTAQNKTEIDFANLPAGIYFYRTYKEGTIVETRKIVKAN